MCVEPTSEVFINPFIQLHQIVSSADCVRSPSLDARYFVERPVMTSAVHVFNGTDRSLFTRARPIDSEL